MQICNKCGGYLVVPYEPYSTSLPPCGCAKESIQELLKQIADTLEKIAQEIKGKPWAGPY